MLIGEEELVRGLYFFGEEHVGVLIVRGDFLRSTPHVPVLTCSTDILVFFLFIQKFIEYVHISFSLLLRTEMYYVIQVSNPCIRPVVGKLRSLGNLTILPSVRSPFCCTP